VSGFRLEHGTARIRSTSANGHGTSSSYCSFSKWRTAFRGCVYEDTWEGGGDQTLYT